MLFALKPCERLVNRLAVPKSEMLIGSEKPSAAIKCGVHTETSVHPCERLRKKMQFQPTFQPARGFTTGGIPAAWMSVGIRIS